MVAEGAPGVGAMDGDGVMETKVGIILMWAMSCNCSLKFIISLSKLRYKYTRCDHYYSTPIPAALILDTTATVIGSAAVDIVNIIGSIVGLRVKGPLDRKQRW